MLIAMVDASAFVENNLVIERERCEYVKEEIYARSRPNIGRTIHRGTMSWIRFTFERTTKNGCPDFYQVALESYDRAL